MESVHDRLLVEYPFIYHGASAYTTHAGAVFGKNREQTSYCTYSAYTQITIYMLKTMASVCSLAAAQAGYATYKYSLYTRTCLW